MVEQISEQSRLEALFDRADIDDITKDPFSDHSEAVELVFTDRVTGDNHIVAGSSLEVAAEAAIAVLDDHQAYRQLRATGLSGSEIVDLTDRADLGALDEEYDKTPEGAAWIRGYEAGASETAEIYAESFSHRVSAIARSLAETITAAPAAAAVGEPVDDNGVANALRVIPIDGAYLALIMPTQIYTD